MNPEPNNWLIAGMTVIILGATYGANKLVQYLVSQLMDKTTLDEQIAGFLGKEDSQSVKQWTLQIARFLVIFVGFLLTWQSLIKIPSINNFRLQTDEYLKTLLEYPTVSFIINSIFVVLITIVFVRVLKAFNNLINSIVTKIKADRRTYIKSFSVQNLEIFSAKQMKTFVLTLISGLRWIVIALILLTYFLILFGIFPATRGLVVTVLAYILSGLKTGWLGFVGYVPSLISLIIIIFITRILIQMTDYIFKRLKSQDIKINGFDPEWADTTFHLARVLLIVLALVVAFPYLPGSDSPALQGISIFFGALLSLGSTSVVGNIMAGIVLTYTSAFNIGDRVKITDTFGDVIEKTLLVTRIRTIKNVEITIPNSMVLSSHIVNYTEEASEKGLILNTTVTLGYDIPWRNIHEALIAAALATEGIDPEPKPFVLQTALDDFYVHYEINAYTCKPEIMAVIYSELHQNIQDKCNEAGIEILSPHYGALRDGNAMAIPQEYLPKGYQAPGFKMTKGE